MNGRVVYLALGSYRVRAAIEHMKELASSGSPVVLVLADSPAWSEATNELSRFDGMQIVRLRPDKNGSVWKAAKILIDDRDGPFSGVSLLIAGDAQALPIAWIARRRRPETKLLLEPYDASGRTATAADVAVITPWYPSPNNPYAGSFVQAATAAVAAANRNGLHRRISVFHTEDWSGKAEPALNDAIKITTDRLQDRRELVPVLDTAEGELVRVPVPLTQRKSYASWVAAQEVALRRALPTGRIEAPVVHAHTGIFGGVLATRLASPEARIVVTEHSSFLNQVFEQRPARALYAEVLGRADAFLCVSEKVATQIALEFPEYADKLRVVPNVIDFNRFAAGPQRDPRMLRWLYVGRITRPKGVAAVLEAFALVARQEPEATLTMVGHGNLEDELTARAAELGVTRRFRLLPPVAPEHVKGLMDEHDLLVHASKSETFGMTVVEAVASGLPVLVSRSGGPEESLQGVEAKVGALMDVSDDPDVIANAYWHLRGASDALDLVGARKELEARYGADAVAEQLISAYNGSELPATAAVSAPDCAVAGTGTTHARVAEAAQYEVAEPVGRAVVLALTPSKPRRIADFASHLVEQGVHVSLITARATAEWERLALHPGIAVLSLESAERKLYIRRAEHFVVYRAPRAVLRRARRVAARSREAIGAELAVAAAQRTHMRYANAFHKKIFNRGLKVVRPRLFAALVRRHAQSELDLQVTDHIFVSDINSTVAGWNWAKVYPHLQVTTHLDRDCYVVK
ncbi:glycosyltransferase family 4 protein [Streptomyces sp. NPDC006475]|uniref:glycosyltransferase family 4 protein n=1 Tax=Streptomyces sp. NPDC006475 TaxID=3155719 RepID=UPI0033A8C00F